jgi:hypothetical protein
MIRAIARPSARRQKSALRALLQDGGASRGPVGHHGTKYKRTGFFDRTWRRNTSL